MRNSEGASNVVKALWPWFLAWILLFVAYDQLIQSKATLPTAEHLMYGVQLVADIFMLGSTYLAYRAQKNTFERRFFRLIFISMILGMCSTETYNILINIFQMKINGNLINESWILFYTGFLVFQLIAWIFLFLHGIKKPSEALPWSTHGNSLWLARLPILQSAILIFLFICFTGIFKQSIFSKMGLTQLSNSLLETLLFMAISLCFSRLKNKDLCYLAAGLLLLITFNLAHRLTYMLHFQYRLFDMAWLLSYIVIIYGFYRSWKNQKPIQFFEENSIHVLTGAIFLAFTGFLFIIFTALEIFIAFLQGRTFSQAFMAFDNMASVLVFTFMFSVLTGKIVAAYWSAPVDKIMKRIQRAQEYPEEFSNSPPPDFIALEVKALDAFITKTIGDLQLANQVKANFLMNMSHDFSTPASGIYMLATSVYNRLEDRNLKRYQSMVVESSRQFLALLEDVLDFSRFSNQKINPKYSNIKINELINDIIALMTPKVEEKGLKISSEMDNLAFSSDPVLLQRILINLVSNAVKFTEKGFVFIKVESVMEEGVRELCITIQDTGIGIDKKDHERIFEPFMRLMTTQSSKYPGIGLGLSNVKSMLEALSGKITLESVLGEGSAFTIKIPEKNP